MKASWKEGREMPESFEVYQEAKECQDQVYDVRCESIEIRGSESDVQENKGYWSIDGVISSQGISQDQDQLLNEHKANNNLIINVIIL